MRANSAASSGSPRRPSRSHKLTNYVWTIAGRDDYVFTVIRDNVREGHRAVYVCVKSR